MSNEASFVRFCHPMNGLQRPQPGSNSKRSIVIGRYVCVKTR